MISTRWAVPQVLIRHCWESRETISLCNFSPLSWITFKSAGSLRREFNPENLTTTALILLSLKTVPIPPLPACLSRGPFRLLSQREKLRHPRRVFSAPLPAETTEMC